MSRAQAVCLATVCWLKSSRPCRLFSLSAEQHFPKNVLISSNYQGYKLNHSKGKKCQNPCCLGNLNARMHTPLYMHYDTVFNYLIACYFFPCIIGGMGCTCSRDESELSNEGGCSP